MKLSPRTSTARLSGFTLVELLVVIAVIAILMGLLFPVLSEIHEHTLRVQALNDEKLIVGAINAYYSEYGKYPVNPATNPGDAVFSANNNAIFDVLRNMTGTTVGNSFNSRGVVFLQVAYAQNQNQPAGGLQVSSGVWYDPWGSPYNVAVDGNYDGQLNSPTPLPNFYSDAGALQTGEIAWSFGRNGLLGGGPAAGSNFSSESGTPGVYKASGDVCSW